MHSRDWHNLRSTRRGSVVMMGEEGRGGRAGRREGGRDEGARSTGEAGGRTICMRRHAVFGTYAVLSWSPQEAATIFMGFMARSGGGCGCGGAVWRENFISRAPRFWFLMLLIRLRGRCGERRLLPASDAQISEDDATAMRLLFFCLLTFTRTHYTGAMPGSTTSSSQHRRIPKLTKKVVRAFEVVDEERFTFSKEHRKVQRVWGGILLVSTTLCVGSLALHTLTRIHARTPRHRLRRKEEEKAEVEGKDGVEEGC